MPYLVAISVVEIAPEPLFALFVGVQITSISLCGTCLYITQ